MLIWLQKELLSRVLKDAAATIYVARAHPGVLGLEDQDGGPVIKLHIGKNLALPAPVFFFEHHLLTQVVMGGLRRELTIPYQAILRSDRFVPVTGGGTKIRQTA
jgi:hypothetical protein